MIKLKSLITERSSTVETIFMDMDGVLCDFDSQFGEYLSNDVLFKAVVGRRKAITVTRLERIGMTKDQFIQKAYDIRKEVLSTKHSDLYEVFKQRTKNELSVSLAWPIIGMAGEMFWSGMDWMPGGKELMKFVMSTGINVEVLTAGSSSNLGPTSDGKQKWLKTNGLGNLKFNIVQKGTEKFEYADPSSLLIDDMTPNVKLFIESGGQGIVHTDTNNTIKQIQSIIKKGTK